MSGGSQHEMAIALGANAGDRRGALAGAIAALSGMGEVCAVSSLYESAASELLPDADEADRAPYLNAVVRLRTHLPPEAVLAGALAHEALEGRNRGEERRHGARTLDIDILLSDREVRESAFLRLPHPRMATRSFVLEPLREAWPDAPHPGGRPWPATGWGQGRGLARLEGPSWASEALSTPVPRPGDDLLAEASRLARRGEPPLYVFGEVGSTADVLRALAAGGAPHGTAVVAERQSAGRGRHGRVWWAPPYTSLLLSVLLRDAADLGGALPLLVGLAAVDAVEAAGGGELRLKWPNDVVLRDGRKAAGILVERMGDGSTLVGIGTNLAPLPPSAPQEVLARSASLADAGPSPKRELLLRHLSARLRTLAAETRERGTAAMLARWRERSSMIGRPVTVHPVGSGTPYRGIAAAVAADGALVVHGEDGAEHLVHAGDVSLTASASAAPK
jgi:BirA family biotin operon repressor/biotin-[acetyl-CoA-carboxylase] ligase